MPFFFRLSHLLLASLFLVTAGASQAHQVPVMQIEAEFLVSRNYTLRINLDPRVFLSDQPTSLPPVNASWYRDQTPEQIKATEKTAMEYLRKNVRLEFGIDEVPLPDCTFVALDGATNKPITDDTQEVHLQATAKGEISVTGRNFSINLGRQTGVSLVLLNTMEGQSERKPRVLFPGEISDPFPLTGMQPPAYQGARMEQEVVSKSGSSRLWIYRGIVALGILMVYIFAKKRRAPKLETRKRRH